MSKVMTFSRVFPSYHPKAGESTHFVEAIMNSLYRTLPAPKAAVKLFEVPEPGVDIGVKHHTIRAGHRWKEGDWFSPRVWSGKPYNSKQITFAPDIQVKKTWKFANDEQGNIFINDELYAYTSSDFALETLAANDGLYVGDFLNWFNKPIEGQIICWNKDINY